MAAPVVQVASRERRIDGAADAALVEAVRRGDDRAFEQLYHRYHRRIAAYIHGMVGDHGRAEDVAQDVFISALRRIRATDRPIAFKPWIYEIAKNACIDLFRRSRRVEELSFDADDGLAASDHRRLQSPRTPDVAVDEKESLAHLRSAFGGLSETHHAILVLREFEGLSYREIGERLGMTRPAVESTLFRARRRLTEEYEELASGAQCTRVQGLIVTATAGTLGLRDRRKLDLHVAHCGGCRRRARLAGVKTGGVCGVGTRIAALFPLPLFLGRRPATGADGTTGNSLAAGAHAPAVAQWSAQFATAADPALAGWAKAAAAAATIAIAGLGASAVSDHRQDPDASARAAPSVAVPATGLETSTPGVRAPAPIRTAPVTTAPGASVPRVPERVASPAGDRAGSRMPVASVPPLVGRPRRPENARARPLEPSPVTRLAPVPAVPVLVALTESTPTRPVVVRPMGAGQDGLAGMVATATDGAASVVVAGTRVADDALVAGTRVADDTLVAVAAPLVGG